MKNLFTHKEFVNEAKKKKELTDQERVMDGVKNVLDGYFTQAKKPEYEYNKDGFPTQIKFLAAKEDFNLDWTDEPLKTEYSEVVALKHVYEVELVYKDKKKEKDGDELWMTFTVKFKKVAEKDKLPKWREEVKKKKEEDEEEVQVGSKDEEWYGKDDDDIDDDEIDKKAKAKAEKKNK